MLADLANASQASSHAPCRPGPASSDSRQGATSRRHLRGASLVAASRFAADDPPAQRSRESSCDNSRRRNLLRSATEEPAPFRSGEFSCAAQQRIHVRTEGGVDILLRVIATENPPAMIRNRGTSCAAQQRHPLTCLFCRRIPPAYRSGGIQRKLAAEVSPAMVRSRESSCVALLANLPAMIRSRRFLNE